MMKVRLNAGLLLTVLAGAALAQVSTPLPGSLSGRWTYIGRAGTLIDSFSIVFEKTEAAGPIPGKLTWRGFNCGAKDEPIEATWDGSELRFEAVLKPDVNTQRMNGNCSTEPTRWVLRRKVGDRHFEGEGRVGANFVTVTTAP